MEQQSVVVVIFLNFFQFFLLFLSFLFIARCVCFLCFFSRISFNKFSKCLFFVSVVCSRILMVVNQQAILFNESRLIWFLIDSIDSICKGTLFAHKRIHLQHIKSILNLITLMYIHFSFSSLQLVSQPDLLCI